MVRYCLMCGARLVQNNVDGKPRLMCTACGWIFYPQVKVGAGVRLVQNGKLLVLRRNQEPFRDTWNLPAGYIEVDETPQQAAEREAWEETGLRVRTTHLVGAYFFDDDPRGNGILLVYDCELMAGQAHPDGVESTEFRFCAPGEIPAALAGGGHDQAIRAWQEQCDA